MKKSLVVAIMCIFLFMPLGAKADNITRDYIPAPPGTVALLLYYSNLSADSIYSNGHKVVSDVDFTGNVGLFRPVYYTKLGPFTIDPQFILPFGNLSLESNALGLDVSSSGIGDPMLLATIWFINNPRCKTYLGFTPFFFLPIGNYDNDGALSLGENRWRFREELGFVQGFEVLPQHNLYFELTVGADFFTKNDDFGPASRKLEQDPIFNLESHLSYDVTTAFFTSLDYYFHAGGEQSVDGFDLDNSNTTHTLGVTLGYNFAPGYQFLFQYKHDLDVEYGLPTQSLTFRFLYAFDVGQLFGKGK